MTYTHILNPQILQVLFLLLGFHCCSSLPTTAQTLPDSGKVVLPDSLTRTHASLYQIGIVGTPLVVQGVLFKYVDNRFRGLRNNYIPRFDNHIDDYLQYSPAAVLLAMKAMGVKGRSSWERMLVSDAFSIALMAGVVNSMKYSFKVQRPDHSGKNSFPSGHTATAFMTASMLNKEYGHLSPWIGIGAYSVATLTGTMRIANNKHWISDVLTGAGIGILSTEIGYLFGDLIFKKKGINNYYQQETFEKYKKPSFFSLYVGLNIPFNDYMTQDGMMIKTQSGASTGFEGAYFFTPYWGVGGRLTASYTTLVVDHPDDINAHSDAVSFCVGPYFSYPLSSRWYLGYKAVLGAIHYAPSELEGNRIAGRTGITFGSGFSITFKSHENYGIRFFLDHNVWPSHNTNNRQLTHLLVPGSSFIITF